MGEGRRDGGASGTVARELFEYELTSSSESDASFSNSNRRSMMDTVRAYRPNEGDGSTGSRFASICDRRTHAITIPAIFAVSAGILRISRPFPHFAVVFAVVTIWRLFRFALVVSWL